MSKQICIKNHKKILKIYNDLNKKDSKKKFNDKINLLKNPLIKEIISYIFNINWTNYKKIIDIIYLLLKNIKSSNKFKNINKYDNNIYIFLLYIYKNLNKIKKSQELVEFFYKILNINNLFVVIKKILKILSNKSKCVKLLKK